MVLGSKLLLQIHSWTVCIHSRYWPRAGGKNLSGAKMILLYCFGNAQPPSFLWGKALSVPPPTFSTSLVKWHYKLCRDIWRHHNIRRQKWFGQACGQKIQHSHELLLILCNLFRVKAANILVCTVEHVPWTGGRVWQYAIVGRCCYALVWP